MPSASIPAPFLERRERHIALALATLGVLRLLCGAAVFPFFANTDEHAHLDVVLKYARGYLPRVEDSAYDRESAALILLYRSPEYFHAANVPPPLWKAPAHVREEVLREGVPFWMGKTNHEVFQPPLYYLLAAGGYRLARGAGLEGVALLYSLRLLNGLLFGLTCLVAFLFCRDFCPGGARLRISVLLLLAVFPQDSLFTIGNDALSPLVFLGALYLVLRLRDGDRGSLGHAAAGLAVAAAFLTKFTNAAIVPVSLGLWWAGRRARRVAGRPTPPAEALAFALALLLPVSLWLGWNTLVVGDATGHAGVAGWTRKGAFELLGHPIFGREGALHFVWETTASFWRGELVWQGQRLRSAPADLLYVSTTLVFVLAGVLRVFVSSDDPARRRALAAAASSLLLGVLLLAGVSVAYDFGDWLYPNRESPFLTSGRLLSGALVPFLVLYLGGLELLLSRVSRRADVLPFAAAIALVCLASEIRLAWPVAASPYNWLHL